MKKVHKNIRLEFAKKYMTWNKEKRNVVFSDEKKFNLNGQDGWNYYWHDIRKEPEVFKKIAKSKNSCMVGGAFCGKGKLDLIFIEGDLNSITYQVLLNQYLISDANRICEDNWVFKQDNAPSHVSKSTIEWLDDNGIEYLKWPPLSPDLNPIEHLRNHVERDLRKLNCSNIKELKNKIKIIWENIDPKVTENLVFSIQRRLQAVIYSKGGPTKY